MGGGALTFLPLQSVISRNFETMERRKRNNVEKKLNAYAIINSNFTVDQFVKYKKYKC